MVRGQWNVINFSVGLAVAYVAPDQIFATGRCFRGIWCKGFSHDYGNFKSSAAAKRHISRSAVE